MNKSKVITIKDTEITILEQGEEEYVCLTELVKNMEDGDQLIKKWLSTKNTIEFLGVWETFKNPNFNLAEFGQVKNDAGSNKFTMSVKKWITATNGIGLKARSGRHGSGTFAHKDIAIKFAGWLSPEIELLVILEFQRLKEEEQQRIGSEWDFRRMLSKINYKLHTSAIKENLIPIGSLTKEQEGYIYANEAEVLNFALFGTTAREWKKEHRKETLQGQNIRDFADAHQLLVLSNLESLNAGLIRKGVSRESRLQRLREESIFQLKALRASNYTLAKIASPYSKHITTTSNNAEFDKQLKGIMAAGKPPPFKSKESE